MDHPFKLLVIEREYSTPDIPSWKRKMQLTKPEAKSLVASYAKGILRLKVAVDTIMSMGLDFTLVRELVKISKNYYGIITMLEDATVSLNLNNHWSWVNTKEEDEEYLTTLFVPDCFTAELIKRVAIMVEMTIGLD